MSFDGGSCSRLKPRMSSVNLVAGGCVGLGGLSLARFCCEALAGSRLVDRGISARLWTRYIDIEVWRCEVCHLTLPLPEGFQSDST